MEKERSKPADIQHLERKNKDRGGKEQQKRRDRAKKRRGHGLGVKM